MPFVVFFFVFFFLAPRVLIFDNAQGFVSFAASLCGVRWDTGRRRRVPLGGLFCSALCALAFGHPVDLVAGRVVLAECWSGLLAQILGLAPLRRRKATLELIGLWGALSVWGWRYSFSEAAAVSAIAVALPALHEAGCRALSALLGKPRAPSGRGPRRVNTASHAIQAAAWVAMVGAVRLTLALTLGVSAALHGALAASAVLRRPRRRRLTSGAYHVRARRCRAQEPAGSSASLRVAAFFGAPVRLQQRTKVSSAPLLRARRPQRLRRAGRSKAQQSRNVLFASRGRARKLRGGRHAALLLAGKLGKGSFGP